MPTVRYWVVASIVSLLLAAAGTVELMIRRDASASLYLVNKAVAGTAFLMIVASYVLSAIHAFWGPLPGLLPYRRYAGLVGYGYAVLHIVLVMVIDDPEVPGANKFPFPEFYLEQGIAILFALTGFVVFSHAFSISIQPAKRYGTPTRARAWRSMLRFGYIGVIAVLVHAVLLKYEGWLQWAAVRTPLLPPLSLIVATLGAGMVVLKILQLARERRIF